MIARTLPALVPALALAARAAMKKQIAPLLAAILAAALPRMSHADARAWRADLASEEVHNEYVRRGDSATLRVAVYLRGREYRPAAAVARYRAGLDSPDWLQAPCTVSSNVVEIAWSPMLAPGADVIPMLVHVDGEVYRVPVMLYVRDSPDGDDPGALPVLDFADYSVTNAPWIETETDPTVPAWAKAATPPLTEEVDPIASAWLNANTNAQGRISHAARAESADGANSADRAAYADSASYANHAESAGHASSADGASYAGVAGALSGEFGTRSSEVIFTALDAAATKDELSEAIAAIPAPDLSKLPDVAEITVGGTNLVGLLPEYIATVETERATVYHGTSRDTSLRDGKLVLLYLATQPSSAFSLNLQLANGSWTGAKPVHFWGTTAAGTQISAGSIIHIVYRGGAWFWSDRDTNSDTYDRVRINQEIRAASAIGRNSLCGADTNGMGYVKLAPGVVIDPAQPLLYLNKTSTLAAGSRDSNFYRVTNVGTALLSYHGVAGKQRRPLYLLGALSDDGRAFTVGDPAFSYEPEPPCFPLGLFHAATTNSFYFIPGPLISGQTGGDASAVTNLVADLLADEVEALPVQSTVEVHRLVLADLWDRVDRMAGASDADAIDDIRLAIDSLDARLTALEGAASINAVRISEVARLLDTQLSGTLQVDSGGVASDRSAGEEALVRGDVAPTSD